ncbi:MAG: hypothetical protein CMI52_04185 [Parcubacteria group bacterium]|nr:hypothetical protein [Parcubacteria group bacterium]
MGFESASQQRKEISNNDQLDSVQKTIESLRGRGELGSVLADSYEFALAEFLEVAGVDVIAAGPDAYPKLGKIGGFVRHQSRSETGRPMVVMNVDSGLEHFDGLMREYTSSISLCAERIGVSFEDMTPSSLAAFIFLHEMGHAYDYLENVPDGEVKRKKRFDEMATLPLPGWAPSRARHAFVPGGQLALWFEANKDALAQQGYDSPEVMLDAQARAYRDLPSEVVADEFAVGIMQKHFDRFFS